MIDIAGTELTAEDRSLLQQPVVGGVIFFKRNYQSLSQLKKLVQSIRAIRPRNFLLAVDHEGGRVQRFTEGFVRLPRISIAGELYDRSPQIAKKLSYTLGWIMASEVLACGIDLSFAPVLDLNNPISTIISDRAFHADPYVVTLLATHYIHGMRDAGMAAVGKHFPGHGSIVADSHIEIPVDERDFATLYDLDLQPFVQLCQHECPGLMIAHVIYPHIDKLPAGFSKIWLQDILRKKLNFNGVIFSDALDMVGADAAGDFPTRAQLALDAGCDMILMCNNRAATSEIVEAIQDYKNIASEQRLHKILATQFLDWDELHQSSIWQENITLLQKYI